MQDEIIYSNGDVVVTKTLVRIRNISYPVNGIGSVLVVKPAPSIGAIILALIIAVFGLGAVNSGSGTAGYVAYALAALLTIGTFAKPFSLILRTASGDQNALSHRDRAFLEEIKRAIETAVIKRG